MVRDHHEKLGPTVISHDENGHSIAEYDLTRFTPAATFVDIIKDEPMSILESQAPIYRAGKGKGAVGLMGQGAQPHHS